MNATTNNPGNGEALATMADQFGQLAMSWPTEQTSPSPSNGWWSSPSAGSRALNTLQ